MKIEGLKHSKWTIVYLMWMCGVIILYSLFVDDPDDKAGLLVYNCIFSILVPAFFVLVQGRMRRIALVVFFVVSLVPSLVETGWFILDQSPLIRNQFWVVFDTNPSEAFGLLSMVEAWQWGCLIVFACISIDLLVLALSECDRPNRVWVSWVGVGLLGALCLVPGIRHNVPYINFYNSYRGYWLDLQKAKAFMANRTDLTGQVTDGMADSTTIVVVIGESVTRHHCSLYGYCRPTNPRLAQRDDIVVYEDVRSADYMTQTVLQQVLSFADEAHPEARWNSPTLPELLHAAGWSTYWFDPYEGSYNTANSIPSGFSSIAKLCHTYHLADEGEQYDEGQLVHLDKALKDSTRKKAIFMHLIGNHFPYDHRYPQTYRFFTDEDICSPYADRLNASQKAVINTYDDAVRYNDWLIDSVLNRLGEEQTSCAMLYFPDHGEEVYDYDLYAGRSFNHVTRSLYEIPCVFWQNEAYARANRLYLDPHKAYCTADMIHTFLDLFAVSYAEQDTCRSLFRQTERREDAE